MKRHTEQGIGADAQMCKNDRKRITSVVRAREQADKSVGIGMCTVRDCYTAQGCAVHINQGGTAINSQIVDSLAKSNGHPGG